MAKIIIGLSKKLLVQLPRPSAFYTTCCRASRSVVGIRVVIWLRTFGVIFVALGESRQVGLPQYGLLGNQCLHALYAAFYAYHGSPHFIDILLWLCAGLHHRKRNINFRKYPKD
eukprot:4656943-Pleurochrysis_carterae.AAC.2